MQRIVLRHLSGSKANQVEEFPLAYFNELIIGRDPSATVKYDPDRDDLVGRQHAKILRDSSDGNSFILTDLNSRNGTFVNGQRIIGSARISLGDVVRFGAGGPEFQFDLEPGSSLQRNTDVAGSPKATPPPPTRSGVSTIPPTRALPTTPQPVASITSGGVGKATVERMVADTHETSRRMLLYVGGALLALIVLVAGFLIYQNITSRNQRASELAAAPMTPAMIAKANTDATVFIEVGWELFYTPTGDKIWHKYVPNIFNNNGMKTLAAYIQFPDGRIEPWLTTDNKDGINKPIGGMHTGSGFVVQNEGFIMTNRHVANTWQTNYEFPSDAAPGIVFRVLADNSQGDEWKKFTDAPKYAVGTIQQPPYDWVPAEAKAFGRKPLKGKLLDGKNDYLEVTFAKNERRLPARVVAVSDRHDVTMIKIEIPQSVQKVELFDNSDQIQPGDSVVILGYPGLSPDVVVGTRSQDPFNRVYQYKVVPDPTVTGGLVGKIIRGEQIPAGREKRDYVSMFGDSIQLTANAAGAGNSGGPVFDDHGRVIGIFYAGRSTQGDAFITFAVPIRFGLELMTTSRVLK